MEKDNSGLRQTKIEKTGDHTFNVHTEDGGHFECNSEEKLSHLKNVTHIKSTNVFSGIGNKKILICDSCKKESDKLQGTFDKTFKKIIYLCKNCKDIDSIKKIKK